MVDAAQSLRLGRTEAVVFQRPVEVVVASGADAAAYLQGQLSQNVTALAVGDAAYSLVLAPQGHVNGFFRLLRRADDEFWLVVTSGFAVAVVERLARFKLSVECELTVERYVCSSFRGPEVGTQSGGGVEIPVRWPGQDGVDFLSSDGFDNGVEVGDDAAFEWLRIDSGEPVMGSELDDRTIPAAAGVVDLAVDFTKGCYVGQELVARVDSRGNNTPKKLYCMTAAEPVEAGAKLQTVGGDNAGVVTSAATVGGETVALGYVNRSASEQTLHVSVGDVAVPVQILS